MCGLAGSFTGESKKGLTEKQRLRRARVLEGLLVANAARGTDATGIVTVCGNKRCVYKKAIPAFQFVEQSDARRLLRSNDPIILGHTRFATTGKNTDKNAHPFEEGDVVGTHNGIISNYTSLDAGLRQAQDKKYEDYEHVEVDSQAVFRWLNWHGPAQYVNALKKVRGSAALVWHDRRNVDGLWMVSHNNPLNVAFVPSMNTLFWASQYDHLSSVLWGVFGDSWLPVHIKSDTLYLFQAKDLLSGTEWKVQFGDDQYSQYSQYSRWEDDPDEDAKVKHPYAVATVTRKDEGKGKDGVAGASRGMTSSVAPPTTTSAADHVMTVLHRMGIPFDMDEGEAAENGSPRSTSEEELAPFDDQNCSVCMESIEDVELGYYYSRTGSWVCRACQSYWEDEGQGNLLEAMGHD